MKFDFETQAFRLRSGRRLWAPGGVLALSEAKAPKPWQKLSYDPGGGMLPADTGGTGERLTAGERRELARYQVHRWAAYGGLRVEVKKAQAPKRELEP